MDFTREPIVESVITPKEGCKLVIRSSKSAGPEEHFVDAVEVVSFGNSLFFRSLERPKAFLVPASDYEVLEVREARLVLKNVGIDRSIKIGGGREAAPPRVKEQPAERGDASASAPEEGAAPEDRRLEKKRDRRRQSRRRRGRDEISQEGAHGEDLQLAGHEEKVEIQPPRPGSELTPAQEGEVVAATSTILSTLLPPPPTLIRETIARYKDNALFKDAFYTKEEQEASTEEMQAEGEEKPSSETARDRIQDLLDEEDDELHIPTNHERPSSQFQSTTSEDEEEKSLHAPVEEPPFLSSEAPAEHEEVQEMKEQKEPLSEEEVDLPAHPERDDG